MTIKKKRTIPGMNIQWPWSRLILEGKKTIETRHYPLPQKYLGQPLAIIETPGRSGKKSGVKSAVIGVIVFSDCYQYKNRRHWLSEQRLHLVKPNDNLFAWTKAKQKWAWVIEKTFLFPIARPAPKNRGIIFCSEIEVPRQP
jgi:hypothetical protein